jgi:hypothetical protein
MEFNGLNKHKFFLNLWHKIWSTAYNIYYKYYEKDKIFGNTCSHGCKL